MRALRTATFMAIVIGLSSALAGCVLFDPQGNLNVRDVMNAEYDAPDASTQEEEITDEVCGEQLDCVEAYSTAEANYYRFDSRQRAEEYWSTLADGFVVNYIVMDFAGKNATVTEQLWAMQATAGMWNDYEGDYPDRR